MLPSQLAEQSIQVKQKLFIPARYALNWTSRAGAARSRSAARLPEAFIQRSTFSAASQAQSSHHIKRNGAKVLVLTDKEANPFATAAQPSLDPTTTALNTFQTAMQKNIWTASGDGDYDRVKQLLDGGQSPNDKDDNFYVSSIFPHGSLWFRL